MRSTRFVLVFTLLLLTVSASASRADAFIDRQGWVKTGPIGPVAPAEGNLYVSVLAGQEQARTYIHLVDPTTTGIITLTEATDGIASDSATLAACALTVPYTGQGDAPELDCARRVSLTRSNDGHWTLPLDVFAGKLANGIGIIPEDTTGNFTVSLASASTSCLCTEVPPAEKRYEPITGNPTVAFEPSGTVPQMPDLAASTPVLTEPPPPAVAAPDLPTATTTPDRVAGTPERSSTGRAASPPFYVILIPVMVAAAVLWGLKQRPLRGPLPAITLSGRRAGWGTATVLLALLLLMSSESTTFRLGFIAIVFIGAIGLHVLVNWAGELSLGHAVFVGLPAFLVAQVATHSGLSPILFVPLGVAGGVLLGLVVASAALRARGLQVSLVTLALGIAIIQFLFVRSWVIGPPAGLHVPEPSLFGWQFATNRALVPVLLVVVVIASVTARWIFASKLGRAFAYIRSDPSAAAAAGIPVNWYRALAYAIAGAYAGLAGSSYVIWVQQVSPKAFPLTLGFTYLVIALLAGRGGLGGLALSAILIEGGALFSIVPQSLSLYLGPIALIFNATRYQKGFNGGITDLIHLMKGKVPSMEQPTIRVPVALGTLAIVAGFTALALAWYHTGNTDQTWIQNQEMVSGGLGGLGLIILGAMLLVRDAFVRLGSFRYQDERDDLSFQALADNLPHDGARAIAQHQHAAVRLADPPGHPGGGRRAADAAGRRGR